MAPGREEREWGLGAVPPENFFPKKRPFENRDWPFIHEKLCK